jgi:hypothetical protein
MPKISSEPARISSYRAGFHEIGMAGWVFSPLQAFFAENANRLTFLLIYATILTRTDL